jgi:hypothetical protein
MQRVDVEVVGPAVPVDVGVHRGVATSTESPRPTVPCGNHQMVSGWPYSIVTVLESGRTSWTAVLDALRL